MAKKNRRHWVDRTCVGVAQQEALAGLLARTESKLRLAHRLFEIRRWRWELFKELSKLGWQLELEEEDRRRLFRRLHDCQIASLFVPSQSEEKMPMRTCQWAHICPWCWVRRYTVPLFLRMREKLFQEKMPGMICMCSGARRYPAGCPARRLFDDIRKFRKHHRRERRFFLGSFMLWSAVPALEFEGGWWLDCRLLGICPEDTPPRNSRQFQDGVWTRDIVITPRTTQKELALICGHMTHFPEELFFGPHEDVRYLIDSNQRLYDDGNIWKEDFRALGAFSTRLSSWQGCLRAANSRTRSESNWSYRPRWGPFDESDEKLEQRELEAAVSRPPVGESVGPLHFEKIRFRWPKDYQR